MNAIESLCDMIDQQLWDKGRDVLHNKPISVSQQIRAVTEFPVTIYVGERLASDICRLAELGAAFNVTKSAKEFYLARRKVQRHIQRIKRLACHFN